METGKPISFESLNRRFNLNFCSLFVQVLTSLPFLAILVAHTCSNWGWYMMLIELPFYMKQVLKFNIKENALGTSLPFLTLWLFSMALSKTLDILRARGTISTTLARKIATLFASVVPMLCLLALCYIGCHRTMAVIIMGLGNNDLWQTICQHPTHFNCFFQTQGSRRSVECSAASYRITLTSHQAMLVHSWR